MTPRLLREQHGIVRHDQLTELGLTRSALRWRLAKGQWREVLPRVYATFTGALNDDQRIIAARLYAGGDAQVAGLTALGLHGLRYAPRDRLVHFLIPHARRVASVGFARIHRTTRLDRWPMRNGGAAICRPARAVVDAARLCADHRAVRAMVAEVVQRRLATVDELATELKAARRNGSAALRRAVAEVAAGTRSLPEAELRGALSESTVLPAIPWNPRLVTTGGAALPTPDGWLDDVGIALEVDSREYHLSPDDWERTMARHNLLAQHGALVMHFTPSQIRHAPSEVRRTVEQAYVERLAAGGRASVRWLR